MSDKKNIFICHNSEDIVISQLIHQFLLGRKWPGVEFFYSVVSLKPSENFPDECEKNCKMANLGLILLSRNALKSSSVLEEIEFLKKYDVKRFYIVMSETSFNKFNKLKIDPKVQVLKLYYFENLSEGLHKIAQVIEMLLSIETTSSKHQLKRKFEDRYFGVKCRRSCERRDACTILQSIKCAENEIRIMGENALQPIHGGFEDLKDFLNMGKTVKYLINNYDSEEYIEREEIEGAKLTKRIRADWIATIGNLKQLNQVKKRGVLDVRITDEALIGSIVIIDKWELQFNKYNRTELSDSSREFESDVTLLLNLREGKGEFDKYYKEFEKLWKKSINLELDKINLDKVIPKKFFTESIKLD